MLTSADVKRRARELGFTHVGIANAAVLENEAALFDAWCGRGYDATMGWMRRRAHERRDVCAVLPDTRSVIVVALNYAAPREYRPEPGAVQISQYARGRDYHDVLGGMLTELMHWISVEEPAAGGKFYVDTGPVLEKAWAVRAGIGWQGKHTNIITQDQGSWVFLGVLLTTLALVPDTPATDRCGSCTKCLDACPTRAFVAPYVLDARRCISYLTIEHRGDIPEELAGGCGGWVFGCDVCQDVCPWNIKFARPSKERAWASGTGLEGMTPDELLAMTEEEFLGKFRKSAIHRARWEGFMRNVRNAARNLASKG